LAAETSPDAVFLDTSVVVDRWVAEPALRRSIGKALHSRTVLTSSTVFREFQRVVIEPYRLVADAIWEVSPEATARSRVQDIVVSLSERRWGVGRVEGRVLKVCGTLLRQWDGCTEVSAIIVQRFLESQIEVLRDASFFSIGWGGDSWDIRDRDGYIDKVDCEVARAPFDTAAGSGLRVSCNKARRSCSAAAVLADSPDSVSAVAGRGRRSATRSAASRFLSEPGTEEYRCLGQKMCWPLGDLFIGLECPAHAVIWTQDVDFSVVGAATGRRWTFLSDALAES